MNFFHKTLMMLAIVALFSTAVFATGNTDTQFATIGTGGVTGVYYPTGGAISRIVNAKYETYGIRLNVESTGGSVFNTNAIINGELEFGIVQSDIQYQATEGIGNWAEAGPQEKIRAVFSLHPELVTLVATDESGIYSLTDIVGKTVSIGAPGSGQRVNATDALAEVGINIESDFSAEGLSAAEAAGVLQDGRIDAYFYTVGHPNGSFQEVTAGKRAVHFVPITGMENLVNKFPFYAISTIPVSFYPKATNTEDVSTFGVKATFVSSTDVPAELVYVVVKEVMENLEEFKKLHPALGVLTQENMLDGLSAPLHPGAEQYYKEVGIIQ